MTALGDDFIAPVILSLKVSVLASVIVFLMGTGAAWLLAQRRFFGKTLLETGFMLPLVLPPTTVGFILLVLLGRRSWIGRAIEQVFGGPIVFSWWACVIAAIVVAFPLVYQAAKTGFLSVEKEYQEAARVAGATEFQVLLYITLPAAWRSLSSGFLLGFARGLGEFGATLMLAGNIPGKTQTIPTAIYLAVDAGKMPLAWTLTAATVGISFLMLHMIGRVQLEERQDKPSRYKKTAHAKDLTITAPAKKQSYTVTHSPE
ncbi:molybdate ABC transporter permease subunit [Gorillibacterium massiliense]|uniref:molybdate ABC transporter permease subunit n=1 Tax=Gorillibacterium massiliense TaxID=1280390 RepID=UPI0004BB775E